MTTVYNLHNCAAWASGSYTVGQTVSNDSSPVKAYRCITAGTSAGAGGPTGTGSSITDGTVVWKYLSSVDYTTIAAAVAGVGSIGALTAPTELWFWNDAEWTISSPVTFSGHSTSATNTLTLRAAPGESFRDATGAASNPIRYDQSKGVGIYNAYNYASWISVQEPYVTLFGLQIRGNGNTGSSCLGNSSAGTNLLVDSCIFDQTYGTGSSRGTDSLSSSPVFKNTAVIIWTSASGAVNSFDSVSLYNCTIVRLTNTAPAGTAIAHNYGGLTLVNCGIFGFSALHVGTSPLSFTNCVTDLASPPTGFTRLTYASQFQDTGTTTANRDFRLKSGAGMIDTGTTDTTHIPSALDIYGTSRPGGTAWDIGAYEVAATGSNVTGTGSAAGHATVSGVGSANVTATGSASAHATVSGVGSGLATATGNATGQATVSGVGSELVTATGSSAGLATVSGVGSAIGTATGSSSGLATVSGVGSAIGTATGSSSGQATVSGVGSAAVNGTTTGSSSGQATVSGVGSELATASGSAAGQATVSGTGSAIGTAIGSAAGLATVSGVGSAIGTATGSSAGLATVSGVGSAAVNGTTTGNAAGHATVSGVGSGLATATGSSSGLATVSGVGSAIGTATGSSAGQATVSGVGSAAVSGTTTGNATGQATVSGVPASTATAGAGATVSGVGITQVISVGAITAQAVASAVGLATATAIGTSAGHATVTCQWFALWTTVGTSAGHATASGQSLTVQPGPATRLVRLAFASRKVRLSYPHRTVRIRAE